MIRDTQCKFLVLMVSVLSLSHRTTGGGSWRRLERLFLQDDHGADQWDENRIVFPDTLDYTKSRWRSTTTPPDDAGCESRCHISREYSPVCGTNGVTYQNMGQLQCAMRCGVAVDLHRPFPCSSVVPTTAAPVFTTTSPSFTTTTPRNMDLEECIRTCPSTPEYNPVCGSNQVTYNNFGKMRCARICGVDVNLWRQAPCPTSSTTTATDGPTPATTVTTSDDRRVTEECIWRCPATAQYNPVCGSDDVTYYNIGKLECAKLCGLDVRVQYQGRCASLLNREQFDSSESSSSSEEDYGEENIDPRSHLRNVHGAQHWKR